MADETETKVEKQRKIIDGIAATAARKIAAEVGIDEHKDIAKLEQEIHRAAMLAAFVITTT